MEVGTAWPALPKAGLKAGLLAQGRALGRASCSFGWLLGGAGLEAGLALGRPSWTR